MEKYQANSKMYLRIKREHDRKNNIYCMQIGYTMQDRLAALTKGFFSACYYFRSNQIPDSKPSSEKTRTLASGLLEEPCKEAHLCDSSVHIQTLFQVKGFHHTSLALQ